MYHKWKLSLIFNMQNETQTASITPTARPPVVAAQSPAPSQVRLFYFALVGLLLVNAGVFLVGGKVLARSWKAAHAYKIVVPVSISKPVAATSVSPADSTPSATSYTSKSLGVSFNYRSDWEVTDDGDSVIINSPFIRYDKYTYGDNNQKITQKVRGIFKIVLNKDGGFTNGDITVRASDLIQHPSTLKGRQSSYLSYFGSGQAFQSMAFTAVTRYANGDHISYDPNNKYTAPIALAGGYWDVDAPRQNFAWDEIPVANFDKTDAFNQALDIIKSLN